MSIRDFVVIDDVAHLERMTVFAFGIRLRRELADLDKLKSPPPGERLDIREAVD